MLSRKITDVGSGGMFQTPGDLFFRPLSSVEPTVLAEDGTEQIVSVPYPATVGGEIPRFFRLRVTLTP